MYERPLLSDFILSVSNEACDFHITEGLSLMMTYQFTGVVCEISNDI